MGLSSLREGNGNTRMHPGARGTSRGLSSWQSVFREPPGAQLLWHGSGSSEGLSPVPRLAGSTSKHQAVSPPASPWPDGGHGMGARKSEQVLSPIHARLVSLSSAGYQTDLRQLQQPRDLTPGIATAWHGGRLRPPRSGRELSCIPRGTALQGSGMGQGGGSGVLLLDGLGAELLGMMMFNSSKKKKQQTNNK